MEGQGVTPRIGSEAPDCDAEPTSHQSAEIE
jgi:hypothetical protein